MNETGVLLYLLMLIVVIVTISRISKIILEKMDEKNKHVDAYTEKYSSQEEYKIVVEKKNDSSTRKRVEEDLNDIQNLDPKYSPNVVRGKNGRFKSKKEWKKEQETY